MLWLKAAETMFGIPHHDTFCVILEPIAIVNIVNNKCQSVSDHAKLL